MPHVRRKDQSVDAFSLPVELFEKARTRAAEFKMTRSGFYRFCLAKMLGYSEADALKLSEHRAVLNSIERSLNSSQKSPEEKFVDLVESEADRRMAEEDERNRLKRKPRRGTSENPKKPNV